jgi:hypothetical protein
MGYRRLMDRLGRGADADALFAAIARRRPAAGAPEQGGA